VSEVVKQNSFHNLLPRPGVLFDVVFGFILPLYPLYVSFITYHGSVLEAPGILLGIDGSLGIMGVIIRYLPPSPFSVRIS